MNYCSACGSRVTQQRTHEERERYVCSACGATHYENPRIIVCCTVSWNGKGLMCRRSQEPALGKWTVPSGYLECGETLEEGAARETFEETGVILDPESLELHGVINMVEIHQVAVGFRIELTTEPILRPGPECLEVAFFDEADMPLDELAWRTYMGNSTQRWFNEIRSRDYSIRLGTLGSNRRHAFKAREYKIESVIKT